MKYDINNHARFTNANNINLWEVLLLLISAVMCCLAYDLDLEVFGGINLIIFIAEFTYCLCSFVNRVVFAIICKKRGIKIKEILDNNKL